MNGFPSSIFLLLLDDVLGDGSATGVLGSFPLEVDAVHVPVHDVRDAGFARGTCVQTMNLVS